MPALATAPHLEMMGCPADKCMALESFALPTTFISVLQSIAGFNWPGLVTFCEKYASIIPKLVAAFEGGSSALIVFLATEAADMPQIIADFRAIFAAP